MRDVAEMLHLQYFERYSDLDPRIPMSDTVQAMQAMQICAE
jgi:hypothetical protein